MPWPITDLIAGTVTATLLVDYVLFSSRYRPLERSQRKPPHRCRVMFIYKIVPLLSLRMLFVVWQITVRALIVQQAKVRCGLAWLDAVQRIAYCIRADICQNSRSTILHKASCNNRASSLDDLHSARIVCATSSGREDRSHARGAELEMRTYNYKAFNIKT